MSFHTAAMFEASSLQRRSTWCALALAYTAACAHHHPKVEFGRPDPQHPVGALAAADDGPHPSSAPDYFEWWYYDASFDDGSTATVALYAAEMLSRKHRPAVLVNLLDPSGVAHYSYRGSSREHLSLGAPGEIAIEDSSIARLPSGAFRVQATGTDAQGLPLAVDLTFTPQMPGFKLSDGIIRFDGQVALAWVVPMPRASVEGTVREGDRGRAVRGLGYHDHNWGELNLVDTMAYWYWGRISSPDATVVYADVHFQPDLGVAPFSFVVSGDSHQMTAAAGDATFEPQAPRYLEAAGREVPVGLAIHASGLALDLREDQVLEADNFSLYIPWLVRPLVRLSTRPAYVRSLSHFVLSRPGQPTSQGSGAITEFMYVRQR